MKRRDCMLAVTAALALGGCVMLPPPPPFHPPPPLAFRPPGPLPEGGGERDENGPPMVRPGRQP